MGVALYVVTPLPFLAEFSFMFNRAFLMICHQRVLVLLLELGTTADYGGREGHCRRGCAQRGRHDCASRRGRHGGRAIKVRFN